MPPESSPYAVLARSPRSEASTKERFVQPIFHGTFAEAKARFLALPSDEQERHFIHADGRLFYRRDLAEGV